MTDSDIFDEFQRLWDEYPVASETAEQMATPNSEDNEFIRMAIVGFSYHEETENWCHGHWKLVRSYLDECERLKDTSKSKKFSMLGLGALLGLYSAGKIDDRLYRIGYALLPGFILSKGAAVEAL